MHVCVYCVLLCAVSIGYCLVCEIGDVSSSVSPGTMVTLPLPYVFVGIGTDLATTTDLILV